MSDARAGESVVAKDGLQEKGVKGEPGEALGDDQLDAVSGGRAGSRPAPLYVSFVDANGVITSNLMPRYGFGGH